MTNHLSDLNNLSPNPACNLSAGLDVVPEADVLSSQRLDALTAEAVDLLRQMVSIPSTSRDEQAVSDFLEQHLHQLTGLEVHRHNHNLWLIDPQYDAARPTLLLNAHIDTVRPAASWQHDPFTPSLEDVTLPDGRIEQRLYGLGTNDDGASVVSLLTAFRLLIAEPQPERPNLILLLSAEEEVSGRNGIESVLPLLPPIDVGLVGEPTGMQPAVAEKGLVVLDGVAYGKSGHAARAEGINALYLALDAVRQLRDFRFERVSSALGPIKVTVTGIQCGTTHNVIPDRCTFMVDCRTTDAYTNEQVVRLLAEAIGAEACAPGSSSGPEQPVAPSEVPALTLTPRSTRLQPSGIDLQHPLVRLILAHGREPFGSPTLSDQALMRFPSLKMGPGQSSRSHTADEYVCPAEIRQAILLYYSILRDLRL